MITPIQSNTYSIPAFGALTLGVDRPRVPRRMNAMDETNFSNNAINNSGKTNKLKGFFQKFLSKKA